MRTRSGSSGWRYRQLPAETQARVSDRVLARFAALPPQAFHDDSEVLLTSARRR
jgi:hypothetical protein